MDKQDEIIEEVEVEEKESCNNTIKIAPEVVATIAGIATTEIKGVAGMCQSFAGGIAEKFGAKKNITKGIKVDMKDDNNVIVDLFIIVDFGVRIPELAWEIQESVKNNIETMTGLTVEKVNIHIDGISFKKTREEEKENSAETVADENEDEASDEEIIVEEADLDEIPEEGTEEI